MRTTEPNNKKFRVPNKLIQLFAIAIAAISLALLFVTSLATAQTPAAASKTKQKTTTTANITTTVKATPEPLSGAQLWTMHCSRCHTTRTPGEFTAAQWQTIMRHMRIRANLPASQAREIQKYFEASAGK